MISCRSIIGTAVIEIENGIGLGSVHQVLVDKGVLLTFVVKTNQTDQPYALLPGENIHGIGDFAAMIKNSESLQAIDESNLNVLNEKQGEIFDEIVITVDGNKIGKVVDYHIDSKNEVGVLIVHSEEDGKEIEIPKAQILMIGKEYIILNEEQKQHIHEEVERVMQREEVVVESTPEPVVEVSTVSEPAVEEVAAVDPVLDREAIFAQFDGAALVKSHQEPVEETPTPVVEPVVEQPVQAEASIPAVDRSLLDSFDAFNMASAKEQKTEEKMDPLAEAFANSSITASLEEMSEAPAEKTADDGRIVPFMSASTPDEGSSFLQEQKRLLVGKRLQKDLVGADGNTILYAEEVVTDATIDLLRRIDRKLVVRLAGCVV